MKLRVVKEKYINHQCPAIPKNVMDVFYDRLALRLRDYGILDEISNQELKTVDVRVNQAYKGCSSFHFYITINSMKDRECHLEIWRGERIQDYNKRYFQRADWLNLMNQQFDIKVPQKALDKVKEHNNTLIEKNNTMYRVKRLKERYQLYLRLKEEFDY